MCHLKIMCVEERMATGVSLVIIHHVPPQNHVCRGENGHWSVTSHHTPCAPQNHLCRGENGHWSVTSHHTPCAPQNHVVYTHNTTYSHKTIHTTQAMCTTHTHTHTPHHCSHNHYKQDSCQWVSLNANAYDKVLLCTPNDIRLFMR